MSDQLEDLERIREQVARIVARGDLTRQTLTAMKATLESLDRDIAAIKAKRNSSENQ